MPSIAISLDNVDRDDVARPRRWRIEDIQRFMIVFGLISSLFDGIAFLMLLFVFRAEETAFQTAWFTISLLTELVVVLVLRTRSPALRSRPGSLLLWATVAVAATTFALPFIGSVGAAFGFVPLPLPVIAASVAILLGYVVAAEVAKGWFFRSERTGSQ